MAANKNGSQPAKAATQPKQQQSYQPAKADATGHRGDVSDLITNSGQCSISRTSRLLTRPEAMDALGISAGHFSRLVNGKLPNLPKLPVVWIGRAMRFRQASIDQWILDAEQRSAARVICEVH